MYRVCAGPIAVSEVFAQVARPDCGGVATFMGTVRNHSGARETSYLVYEAYAEMAEAVLGEIGREAQGRFGAAAVSVVHRIGRVAVGELIVVVAVSSEHRGSALSACRFVIDELKERVPIWKREVGPEGEFWGELENGDS